MSAIRRPRASFRGVFTTNVPTANNDKTADTLDEQNIKVVNPFNEQPDGAFRVWMMQTFAYEPEPGQEVRLLNSYFNYFGDSGMSFTASKAANMPYENTVMISSVLPGGETYQQGQDTFLGGQVELWGDPFFDKPGSAKMVDLDPIGIYGTQIFSGEVRVVDYTSGKSVVMLSGKNPTRAYIRDMYLDRNIAPNPPGAWMGGAIWQLGLPLEGLTFNPEYLAPSPKQSPTLMALQQAAKAGQGLLMRFALYYTVDGIDEGKLADQFAASGYKDPITNPATGMLVGSIGAWEKGELASMPLGRLLYPNPNLGIPRPDSGYVFNADARGKARHIKIEAGSRAQALPPYHLAPATVVVDQAENILLLDLLTTIPEVTGISPSYNPQTDLQKADYGDLFLMIGTKDGNERRIVTKISAEQYNRTAYERYSGIIEIPITPELKPFLNDPEWVLSLYAQSLSFQPPLPPNPVLQEIDYQYVLTDNQCLYLHQGESVTYQIQVLSRGQPVRNQMVAITTTEYQFSINSPTQQRPTNRILTPLDSNGYVVSIPPHPAAPPSGQTSDPTPANPPGSYKTDGNGMITLKVTGTCPGAAMVCYQLLNDDFNPNMGGATTYPYFGFAFYNAFRVLPNDNYDNIPDEQVTWDFLYQEVIRYFYLLYPGMFARLAFQNEETARASATVIRQMVSKRTWDSTSYMPVSRDLSDGKCKLLIRWCVLNKQKANNIS
jgi:hypothetical protein